MGVPTSNFQSNEVGLGTILGFGIAMKFSWLRLDCQVDLRKHSMHKVPACAAF